MYNKQLLVTGDRAQTGSGIINLQEGFVMIAYGSVLKNDRTGPSAGTMVFGKFLKDEAIAEISKQLNLPVSIYYSGEAQLPDDVVKAELLLTESNSKIIFPQSSPGRFFDRDYAGIWSFLFYFRFWRSLSGLPP